MTPNLRELQKKMGEAITLGTGTEEVSALIKADRSSISADERFAVYADAWFLRLEESLSDDFSGLRRFFSEETWNDLLRTYFRKFPSRSHTLARLGDQLPAHLKQLDAPAWQVELAQLELDLCRSNTASDEVAFDVTTLQSLSVQDAETLQLRLQPSVFLHEFEFDVLATLQSEVSPASSASLIVVFREQGSSRAERVNSRGEFDFLKKLTAPKTLGELADQVEDPDWVQWLSKWSLRGAIGPV